MKTFALPARHRRRVFRGCFFLLSSLWIIGCVGAGKPPLQIDRYLIDYPAPVFEKPIRIDETIRIGRFRVAGAYNNPNMIFRRDNYLVDSFNYNKWAVNPADMVGDNLLRDMQSSGLFRAVFSRYAPDEGRYILQGGVEEFFLRMDETGRAAVVSLEITLQDTKQREATKRILFQRKYRGEETLGSQSPEGYCRAMSLAMEKLSRRITSDVYQTVKKSSFEVR
jgi:ABC-type uncharacterized transport system auxiliary subunit